jgi:uncharacterized membrane protein
MLSLKRLIFYAVLMFFTVLMVRITLPYVSLHTDVAFLQIKQWVIDNDIWRTSFFIHVFTSLFLLLAGFTQFYNPFQNKIHRNIGKLYIIIILFLSGPAGFVMSLYANGGWPSRIAFTLLSCLWMFFTARAYLEIRNKNYVRHGEFMMRSYALTLSALTLRAWKYGIVMLFHPRPMDAYMIVAWLGWIPNLLMAEWLIKQGYATQFVSKK